ncbi:hypothetical protein REPUB_Repub20aG0035100 [Reevesia pubescens]
MTKEDMYDEAMRVKSGYRRGFGYGKKRFTKGGRVSQYVHQEHEQEVSELRGTVIELRDKIDNLEADRVAHEETIRLEIIENFESDRVEREERMRIAIRQQVTDEVRQMLLHTPMSFPTFHYTESQPLEYLEESKLKVSRELVFLILQFLEEEKLKVSVHRGLKMQRKLNSIQGLEKKSYLSSSSSSEEEQDEDAEKSDDDTKMKPKTKKVKETTYGWELLNDVKALWLRSPTELLVIALDAGAEDVIEPPTYDDDTDEDRSESAAVNSDDHCQVLTIWEINGISSPLSKRDCLVLDTKICEWDLLGIVSLLQSSPYLKKLVINLSPRDNSKVRSRLLLLSVLEKCCTLDYGEILMNIA